MPKITYQNKVLLFVMNSHLSFLVGGDLPRKQQNVDL